jgi:hypothetical protein
LDELILNFNDAEKSVLLMLEENDAVHILSGEDEAIIGEDQLADEGVKRPKLYELTAYSDDVPVIHDEKLKDFVIELNFLFAYLENALIIQNVNFIIFVNFDLNDFTESFYFLYFVFIQGESIFFNLFWVV